jgi:hypothetical protein
VPVRRLSVGDMCALRDATRSALEAAAAAALAEGRTAMKGMWSVPRRNPLFVGRQRELGALAAQLHAGGGAGGWGAGALMTATAVGGGGGGGGMGGVSALAAVGMGGVGKSQIVTEYCHKHYQNPYGLVCWLNAESDESLASDMRKLAVDFGMEVGDKRNDAVMEEVKAALYRMRTVRAASQSPYARPASASSPRPDAFHAWRPVER